MWMLWLTVLAPTAPADELLGQWTFEEGAGALVFDSSGGDVMGQCGSGVARRSGPYGGALSLDGTSQAVVNLPLPPERQFRRESFSVQLWCAPRRFAIESQYQTRRLIGFHDYPSRYVYLDTRSDGHVTLHVSYQAEGGQRAFALPVSKQPIALNQWTHVAAVCDRAAFRVRLYVNGELSAEAALPKHFDGDLVTQLPLTIGSSWQSFDGLVGEVSLHRGALPADAVRAAYNASRERYAAAVTEPTPAVRPGGQALTLHVAPDGDDGWSGTLARPNATRTDGPFRTLTHACDLLQPGDTLLLGTGTYREVLRPGASGTAEAPITIRNAPGAHPVLTATEPLTGWQPEGQGVWSAPMPWSLGHLNQLFADGRMLTEARWPNNTGTLFEPTRATVAAATNATVTDPAIPGTAADWQGAWLWCAGGAAWHAWTRQITAYDPATHTLTFNPPFPADDRFYQPKPGNRYVLMGSRAALDAPGEWWFDAARRRVLLIPPDGRDPNTLALEAKQRATVIDLSERSHIKLLGLAFRGGGLATSATSSDLLLQELKGEYLGHSYRQNQTGVGSVSLTGQRIDVVSCEFALASDTVLRVAGSDNRVVNCYVHDGDYSGGWSGCVTVTGRRQVISRNTFRHSGRDLISVGGLAESIIERNDLSYAGWLTHDLGMTYGHTNDFLNTEFRYNVVHDNVAEKTSMGIYFDHLSMNVIVHHNLIWGTKLDAVRFNNPSFFCLAFHNSAWGTGNTGTFDHSKRNDLFGTRFYNNILPGRIVLPPNAPQAGNVVGDQPGFVDPPAHDFRLRPDSAAVGQAIPLPGFNDPPAGAKPDAGALPLGAAPWAVGHDFANPPALPTWSPANVPYMNGIHNSCFEFGLEGWTRTGAQAAKTVPGNGWGNNWGVGEPDPTGTCKAELELGPGADGVEQTIQGLFPNTCYTFSGWLKAVGEGQRAELAVADFGGPAPEVVTASDSPKWTRVTVEFKTGPTATSARLIARQTGPGKARVDNLGLPRVPAGADYERLPAAVAGAPAPATVAVPPPFTVRRIARPPLLDGRISPDEWPAGELRLEQTPGRERLTTPPAVARLAHDGATLYVAVTVPLRDLARLKRGAAWRTDDGVEVCLVDARGAAPTFSFVSHGFAGGAQAAVTDGGVSDAAAARLGQAIRYRAAVGERSWTGEWAIPLAAADAAYSAGLRLAFNLCTYRSEADEWLVWVGTRGPAWRLADAGTIILE